MPRCAYAECTRAQCVNAALRTGALVAPSESHMLDTPLAQGGSSGGGGAGDNSDNKLDEYVEALKKGGVVRARP